MKLEKNYSAHQKRDDWRLRRFQSNMPSTEVPNLFVRTILKNKENVYPSQVFSAKFLFVNFERNR